MIHSYVLFIIYAFFTSLYLLQDRYKFALSFMLRIREKMKNNRKAILFLIIFGYLLSLVLIFFPLSPGPMFFGDLVPSLISSLDAVYYTLVFIRHKDDYNVLLESTKRERIKIILGFSNIITLVLHFLFPSFVLL